jgi:hypothetical protein
MQSGIQSGSPWFDPRMTVDYEYFLYLWLPDHHFLTANSFKLKIIGETLRDLLSVGNCVLSWPGIAIPRPILE